MAKSMFHLPCQAQRFLKIAHANNRENRHQLFVFHKGMGDIGLREKDPGAFRNTESALRRYNGGITSHQVASA